MHKMPVSMARPKLANSSSITSASPSASCLTSGSTNADGKACLKSDETRPLRFALDRRCQLRSDCRLRFPRNARSRPVSHPDSLTVSNVASTSRVAVPTKFGFRRVRWHILALWGVCGEAYAYSDMSPPSLGTQAISTEGLLCARYGNSSPCDG